MGWGGRGGAFVSALIPPHARTPPTATQLRRSPPLFLAKLDSSSQLHQRLWVGPLCKKGSARRPAAPPSRRFPP